MSNKDCIQIWQEDRAVVHYKEQLFAGRAQNAKAELDEATAWKELLQGFWENIQQTDLLAKDILKTIDKLKGQGLLVAENATQTNDAIRIVICDIHELLVCTEQIRALLDPFMEAIKALDKPAELIQKSKVLLALQAISEKLVAAYEVILQTLLVAVQVHEKGMQMHQAMSDREGLLQLLTDLHHLICDPELPETYQGVHVCNSCDSKIEPRPYFPLAVTKDPFYVETKNQYDEAVARMEYRENRYNRAEKARVRFKTRRESLDQAITQAEKARNCQ